MGLHFCKLAEKAGGPGVYRLKALAFCVCVAWLDTVDPFARDAPLIASPQLEPNEFQALAFYLTARADHQLVGFVNRSVQYL